MQYSIHFSFDQVVSFVCISVYTMIFHLDINLLKSKINNQGRATKIIGRLVDTTPRKTIKELDFNIPMKNKQRYYSLNYEKNKNVSYDLSSMFVLESILNGVNCISSGKCLLRHQEEFLGHKSCEIQNIVFPFQRVDSQNLRAEEIYRD